MNEITKTYRLIWSPEDVILGDPFKVHSTSKTLINTTNYFESDDVDDIQPKIEELELEYPPEEEIEDIMPPLYPPDPPEEE